MSFLRSGNNIGEPTGVREYEGLLTDARNIWENCLEQVGKESIMKGRALHNTLKKTFSFEEMESR